MTKTGTDYFRKTLEINDVLLAPMAGVTDVAFRRVCLGRGALLMYTEMVSAKGLVYRNENTRFLLEMGEEEKATGVQIFGSDEAFLSAAVRDWLNETSFAFIDINMGCPVKKVVSNGEGSALLRDPKKVCSVARSIVEASSKPVSAKIRTGYDENTINVTDNVKALNDAGVGMIAVHGRTREMFYSGKADRELIAKAVAVSDVPVIANGDVSCYEDYVSMKRDTGAAGVMIGRGAMGNPFIFEEIASGKRGEKYSPPTAVDRLREALRHLELMKGYKDERTACCEFRKQLCWYTKGMSGGAAVRNEATKISSFSAFEEYILSLIEKCSAV
ncbi:MAG: tRNA dihydrouridine synthase DusB [Eubacteriaceae bacterium]|nr:tRNA dihydrouridine synthase DusB [Eubacteriaceae bacterium]